MIDRHVEFEVNTEDYSESEQKHLISEYLLKAEREKKLDYEKIELAFKVYHSLKILFEETPNCIINIKFNRPFSKLRADISVDGARELTVVKDMPLFKSILNAVEAGIEIIPRTDQTLYMDFSFFDLEL